MPRRFTLRLFKPKFGCLWLTFFCGLMLGAPLAAADNDERIEMKKQREETLSFVRDIIGRDELQAEKGSLIPELLTPFSYVKEEVIEEVVTDSTDHLVRERNGQEIPYLQLRSGKFLQVGTSFSGTHPELRGNRYPVELVGIDIDRRKFTLQLNESTQDFRYGEAFIPGITPSE